MTWMRKRINIYTPPKPSQFRADAAKERRGLMDRESSKNNSKEIYSSSVLEDAPEKPSLPLGSRSLGKIGAALAVHFEIYKEGREEASVEHE